MNKVRLMLLFCFLALCVGLFGCSGDDGDDGRAGLSTYEIAVANGFTGTEQEWLDSLLPADVTTAAEPESCAVCHANVEETHAATGVPTISGASGVLDTGGNYVITFDFAVDGLGTNAGYQLYRTYVTNSDPTLDDADTIPATTTNVRTALVNLASPDIALPTGVTVSSTTAGAFTVTIDSSLVLPDAAYTVVLRDLESSTSWGDKEPAFVLVSGTSPLRDLVTDDGVSAGCAACHGASASSLFDHYLTKGNECQACHAIYARSSDSYYKDDTGTWVNGGSLPGSNLTEYIHGIHNSHNMPAGEYYRDSSNIWSIGYPSDMRNCEVCHNTADQLAAAVEAPVSYYLCMTCHQEWDGFVHVHDAEEGSGESYEAGDLIFSASDFHRASTIETNCMGCHSLLPSLDEVGDFHNDFQPTDAHYDSFYRGEDISFANNDNVGISIDSITSDGSAVSFTWTAESGGLAVDPCNTTVAAGAPSFQVLAAYLAYAKGDDWVNEFVSTSSPGQPAGSSNLFTSLSTTCASNVATTTGLTLNAESVAGASKVLLAIGGKPLALHVPTGNIYYVREPSPTQAFDPANGDFVTARRDAVDNDKCLACHQGTLYQHGGDRVDNEQLCVICHNPASGDKNNRLDRFQIVNDDGTVNTDATYDGKNNESYDMRVMVHAIHGISKRLDPWTVYRSRGIYAFANPDTALPTGWPDDGMTIYGSTNASEIAHNWTVVHYPKDVNECAACHNDEAYEAADQTKAVALTVDPGTSYSDQSDDIVIGPSAAACLACHATAPVERHATSDFGYKAQVTKDEMLELAE